MRDPSPKYSPGIAQTTAAVTKLKVIWNDKNIAIRLQDQIDVFPGQVHIFVCM